MNDDTENSSSPADGASGTSASGASASGASPSGASAFKDLMPRVLSAIVMIVVALALTYWGLIPFAVLVMIVAVVLSWEWGGVIRGGGNDVTLAVHGGAVIVAVILGAIDLAGLALLVLASGAVTIGVLRFGEKARLSALGVFYAGLPAIGLLWFRGDEPYGFAAVMFLFAVVWMTDIGAYAAGRIIGGPKLWPAVSPKKTWAGLIGGVSAGVIAGTACGVLLAGAPMTQLIVTGLVLGLISQGGDLAESALKRGFDVKDSSSLIPGHGGFMDRVDGLVAAVIAAALFAMATNAAQPAKALLFWS